MFNDNKNHDLFLRAVRNNIKETPVRIRLKPVGGGGRLYRNSCFGFHVDEPISGALSWGMVKAYNWSFMYLAKLSQKCFQFTCLNPNRSCLQDIILISKFPR